VNFAAALARAPPFFSGGQTMWALNSHSRVHDDAELRCLAKRTYIPFAKVKAIYLRLRVCDVCGPPDEYIHQHWLEILRTDPDEDFVQRRFEGRSCWVHRDCAPLWEDIAGLSLAGLERLRSALQKTLIEEARFR
jgi:hypothetical protein